MGGTRPTAQATTRQARRQREREDEQRVRARPPAPRAPVAAPPPAPAPVLGGRARSAVDRGAAQPSGNAPSSPVLRSASTTSHTGSPTTFEYEPSMRSTAKLPMPWTA